jgi:hypothetical protein
MESSSNFLGAALKEDTPRTPPLISLPMPPPPCPCAMVQLAIVTFSHGARWSASSVSTPDLIVMQSSPTLT